MVNKNSVICSDNLQILQQLPDSSVDLVYLDPPLPETDTKDFERTQTRKLQEFLNMLRPRIAEIHRVLAEHGSVFCHSEWQFDGDIQKIFDTVFGKENLIAKIIWQKINPSPAYRHISHTYDIILFYGKSQFVRVVPQYLPNSDAEVEAKYKYVEPDTGNRYRLVNITRPSTEIDRPTLTYEFLGVKRTWRYTKAKMEEEYKQGRIVQSRPGAVPMRKQYLHESAGKLIGDIWSDIPIVQRNLKEKTGYPTQKPIALVERIIQMSTEVGDLILDPFCGSGTALIAAENLGRKWIGIDISPTAYQLATQRLLEYGASEKPEEILKFDRELELKNINNLPHYEFENWVIAALNKLLTENDEFIKEKGLKSFRNSEVYSITKSGQFDLELEGRKEKLPVLVKKKDRIEAREINNFAIQLKHHGFTMGLFVALGYSNQAINEVQKKQVDGLHIISIRLEELLRRN